MGLEYCSTRALGHSSAMSFIRPSKTARLAQAAEDPAGPQGVADTLAHPVVFRVADAQFHWSVPPTWIVTTT